MKILLDTRESQETKDVLSFFLKSEECTLEIGDILIDNTVIFEHKKPADLISSLFDGRLFRQVSEMQENYLHSYIIVSGTLTDVLQLSESIKRYNSVLAAVCSCYARGCPVIFADTLVNMADIVKVLGEKLTDGKSRNRPVTKMKLDDKRLQILCAFKGINEQRANTLLDHFGSIDAVLSASSDDLCECFDIGKVTAENMRDVMEG